MLFRNLWNHASRTGATRRSQQEVRLKGSWEPGTITYALARFTHVLATAPHVVPVPASPFRCFSMPLQASAASAKSLKGEPVILTAPIRRS